MLPLEARRAVYRYAHVPRIPDQRTTGIVMCNWVALIDFWDGAIDAAETRWAIGQGYMSII
jgi:hypothetical protein